jgi:DnaJ-domain-containing protein 1
MSQHNRLVTNPVNKWLKKKVAIETAFCFMESLLSFGFGMVVLTITFLFAYAIVWAGFNLGISAVSVLVFGKSLHLSSHPIIIICSLFLVLLFIENFRVNREHLNSFKIKHPISPAGVAMTGLGGAMLTLLANSDATGKMITDLLFSGPRLIVYSILALCRASRWMRMNVDACVEALTVLLNKSSRVSLNELAISLRRYNPIEILFQLQEIGGVLFIGKDPAGITLTEDLRTELKDLFQTDFKREAKPQFDETAPASDNFDPYALLGVSSSASLDEIKSAYRKCIKQCHPDKFVGRAEGFCQLAEERAKAINTAYETLLTKHETA